MENINYSSCEDPLLEKMKYKIILIIIVIFAFVIIKLVSNQIEFKDFIDFKPISINFKRLFELKEYIIFFSLLIPISLYLRKSNIEWAKEQIEEMEKKEEEKKKEEIEKRKDEFENKMRGVHFHDE